MGFDRAFAQAIWETSRREDVRRELLQIYAEFEEAAVQRKPRCDVSGRCCRFEEFGHRLYVTTAELGVFWGELGNDRPAGPIDGGGERGRRSLEVLAVNPGGCVFQKEGLCGVHGIRPFGCRVFFCDPQAQDWVNETYERFHGRIKAVHERLEVPYYYVEWRQALEALVTDAGGPMGPA